MRPLALGLLLMLAGCATAQPKAEWRYEDGAWVNGAATTNDPSVWQRVACTAPALDSAWCKFWTAAGPVLDTFNSVGGASAFKLPR